MEPDIHVQLGLFESRLGSTLSMVTAIVFNVNIEVRFQSPPIALRIAYDDSESGQNVAEFAFGTKKRKRRQAVQE